MRRIRTIKPEWLTDESLASCSIEARLLSVGLILLADDAGRGVATVEHLACEVFRYELFRRGLDELSTIVRRALDELSTIGFCTIYEVSSKHYYELPAWSRHQRIDRPSPSRIPPHPGGTAAVSPASTVLVEDSTIDRRTLDEPSTSPRGSIAAGSEGIGSERSGSGAGARARTRTRGNLDEDDESPHSVRLRTAWTKWAASYEQHRGSLAADSDGRSKAEVVRVVGDAADRTGRDFGELFDQVLAEYWRDPWTKRKDAKPGFGNLLRQVGSLLERLSPVAAPPDPNADPPDYDPAKHGEPKDWRNDKLWNAYIDRDVRERWDVEAVRARLKRTRRRDAEAAQ